MLASEKHITPLQGFPKRASDDAKIFRPLRAQKTCRETREQDRDGFGLNIVKSRSLQFHGSSRVRYFRADNICQENREHNPDGFPLNILKLGRTSHYYFGGPSPSVTTHVQALKGRQRFSAVRISRTGCVPALKGRNTIAMGQSLVKNYIHIVFSTKHRQPLIFPWIEGELYSYLGGICNNLECTPIKIGGHYDHVHILCFLSKKIALMKLVEELKSHSSSWLKTKDHRLRNFYWQNGYGAFSVKSSEVDIVKGYIENQHAHHAKKKFQEEYRGILKEHETEFDEQYVWD